jgi:arginase family enzyme
MDYSAPVFPRGADLPWYAGNASFLRAPWVDPASVPEGDVAIVGMPLDEYATSMGQIGMRFGPRGIREASLSTPRYYGIQTDVGLSEFDSGIVTAWPSRLPLVDTGDIPIIPEDAKAQFHAAVEHVKAAASTSGITVTLGGDHFVAYPAAKGVIEATHGRTPGASIAYLHIDSHTDFVDVHRNTGRFNHGTAARRVSELPGLAKMAWFGVNGNTQPNQVQVMYERDFRIATTRHIDTVGPTQAMEQVLDYLLDGTDVLYCSVDIDVVNGADAPGTSAPIVTGISGAALLAAMSLLAEVSALRGLDVCEVNPLVDGSRRTEALAAQVILTVVGPRLFPKIGELPREHLDRILLR